MKELENISQLSSESLFMNAVNMKVIIKKLDEVIDEASFRRVLTGCFNDVVSCLDESKLDGLTAIQVNFLAIALDNKLDLVGMIADATQMANIFEDELKRRNNAPSQTDRPAAE